MYGHTGVPEEHGYGGGHGGACGVATWSHGQTIIHGILVYVHQI